MENESKKTCKNLTYSGLILGDYLPKVLEISVFFACIAGIIAAIKPIPKAPNNKYNSSFRNIAPEKE